MLGKAVVKTDLIDLISPPMVSSPYQSIVAAAGRNRG
jgi:hypothetical protein